MDLCTYNDFKGARRSCQGFSARGRRLPPRVPRKSAAPTRPRVKRGVTRAGGALHCHSGRPDRREGQSGIPPPQRRTRSPRDLQPARARVITRARMTYNVRARALQHLPAGLTTRVRGTPGAEPPRARGRPPGAPPGAREARPGMAHARVPRPVMPTPRPASRPARGKSLRHGS